MVLFNPIFVNGSDMRALPHLRLRQRLAVGFGVVLALLMGIAALSLGGMGALNQSLQDVAIRGSQRTDAVMGMERSANRFMATLGDIRGGELSAGEATMKRAREDWGLYQAAEQAAVTQLPTADERVKALLA